MVNNLSSSSSPPRLSRNRRSRGRGLRTTSGCTTCRKRHLKCDELKPICGLCKKAKKTCSYAQQIPTTPSTVSRGRQEKRTESVTHEDEEIVTCTTAQLHEDVQQHTLHLDGDVADLTQTTPPSHNPEPQPYATPHIFSWDHIANDEHEAVIGEDILQQQQQQQEHHHHHPQQSLDQLAAIVAADRDNSSTSSILHNNNFSANTRQSLSTSVSVTSPGPTVNAATIRWFGLLAHDAARSTPEISTVLDHTANSNGNGTDNDYHKFRNFFFARAEEENVDVSSLTPLERATRIVDQQQPSLLGVEGEDSNAHVHAHQFEEQLWQSEKSIQLLSREYLLFEHFVRRVSQWIDLFDPTCKFSSFVPHLAMRNAGLLNAILALSCRHISLKPSLAASPEIPSSEDRPYRDLALQYYYQTLHYVQKAMQYSSYKTSPELLATTLIISTYEMLNDSSKDWQRHLEGVFLIQRSQVIHGDSGGIKSAVWWAWLRQDIWAAFRERRKTLTFWTPKRPYSSLTPFELAARSVYVTAKVIDYCSREAMNNMSLQERVDQASHLRKTLDDWEQHLTVEFSPLPTMSHDNMSVFSPIWICAPAFGVAIQVHCAGQILLCTHEPSMGGLDQFIKKQATVKHCIDIICGIAITLNDDASSLMSSQCLYIAGIFTLDINERNCILDLLDARRKRTGWPVVSLGDELRQLWMTNTLPTSELDSPF